MRVDMEDAVTLKNVSESNNLLLKKRMKNKCQIHETIAEEKLDALRKENYDHDAIKNPLPIHWDYGNNDHCRMDNIYWISKSDFLCKSIEMIFYVSGIN